jgi:hypothetical protein
VGTWVGFSVGAAGTAVVDTTGGAAAGVQAASNRLSKMMILNRFLFIVFSLQLSISNLYYFVKRREWLTRFSWQYSIDERVQQEREKEL